MNPAEVFDRSIYDRLVSELGAADVAEVLNGFLADTSGKLERLSTQISDRAVTQREAHSIKSSSATFGFLELSRQARELEADALQMSTDDLSRAVGQLRTSFVQVHRLAEAILPITIEETVQ